MLYVSSTDLGVQQVELDERRARREARAVVARARGMARERVDELQQRGRDRQRGRLRRRAAQQRGAVELGQRPQRGVVVRERRGRAARAAARAAAAHHVAQEVHGNGCATGDADEDLMNERIHNPPTRRLIKRRRDERNSLVIGLLYR